MSNAIIDAAPATRTRKARWGAAILCALVPVVFTAAGSAAAQLAGLSDVASVLVIAAAVTISAVMGILVVRPMRRRREAAGFSRPTGARLAWWFLPLAVTVILVLATGGIAVSGELAAAYAVLVVAVAVNEETWFRGVVLALLRPAGIRTAVIGSTVLFGVLHLANLAGGADLGGAVLQVLFAVLFGIVAAQLAVVTGSLWPVIIWHAGWNFASYLGGNATTPLALAGVGAACVVMLVYALRLRRATLGVGS